MSWQLYIVVRKLRVAGIATIVGCASDGGDTELVVSSAQGVVYGHDNRVDFSSVSEPLRILAESVSVALVPGAALTLDETGVVRVDAPLAKDRLGLCVSESFREQPAAAECSGVLIDDDLVLTAGHCFSDSDTCDKFAYVMGYFSDENDGVSIETANVFGCRRIVSRERRETSESDTDYAIVQLDRATGRIPAAIAESTVTVGDVVVGMGYPSGLPLKIDRGPTVTEIDSPSTDFFSANIDAYEGSSGSPVFNNDNFIVGTLVAGAPMDYVFEGGCAKSRVVPVDERKGEVVLRIDKSLTALCSSGFPSARLCENVGTCGDDFCSLDESASCSKDCGRGRCSGLDCLAHIPLEYEYAETTTEPVDANVTVDETTSKYSSTGCHFTRRHSASSAMALLVILSMVVIRRRTRDHCWQLYTSNTSYVGRGCYASESAARRSSWYAKDDTSSASEVISVQSKQLRKAHRNSVGFSQRDGE